MMTLMWLIMAGNCSSNKKTKTGNKIVGFSPIDEVVKLNINSGGDGKQCSWLWDESVDGMLRTSSGSMNNIFRGGGDTVGCVGNLYTVNSLPDYFNQTRKL